MTGQHQAAPRRLYIGAYTAGAGGTAAGVAVLSHDPVTGDWTSPVNDAESSAGVVELTSAGDAPQSPSFLAWHPDGRHLYAVGEVAHGRVWAYQVDGVDGAPRVIGSAPTGGEFPCHLSVDPSGRYVVSANYGSGSLAVHRLLPGGTLGPRSDLLQHRGSGPDADRQAGPHAHMACFADGTLVLAVDLRADGVAACGLDTDSGRLRSAPAPWSRLPAGFGPRHLVLLPENLVAVAGELSGEIALLRLDPATGELHVLDIERASERALPSAPSGIAATGNGRFVIIANRGPDTVASFAVDHHLGGAYLRPVDEIDCGGAHPRAVTIIGELLDVANQHGGNVCVLHIDEQTGDLTDTGSRISTLTPTHVLAPPTVAAAQTDSTHQQGYSR